MPRPGKWGAGSIGIERFVLGPLETNSYVVWDPVGREALVIDPGEAPQPLLDFIAEQRLQVHTLLNTHGHADHIAGNRAVKQATQACLMVHAADAEMLVSAHQNLSEGLGVSIVSPPADRILTDGDVLSLGPWKFRVLESAGHTNGSICLLGPGVLFSGDTLFFGSVGRTDLPGGSGERLGRSLCRLMALLPDDTRILPGHGPETQAGMERRANPFIRGQGNGACDH